MNKTIKVIDLLNEVSRGNNLTFKDGGGTYKDSLWTLDNKKIYLSKEVRDIVLSEIREYERYGVWMKKNLERI